MSAQIYDLNSRRVQQKENEADVEAANVQMQKELEAMTVRLVDPTTRREFKLNMNTLTHITQEPELVKSMNPELIVAIIKIWMRECDQQFS